MVVPNFQSGDRLREFLPHLEDELAKARLRYEIIVVDDASTDGSADGVEGEHVLVVRHPRNTGKGGALRTGFGEASGRLIGFIDGDGQYGPDALGAMSHLCDAGWDLVVGQRFDPDARVRYSASRTMRSRVMLGLVHLLVDPTLSETQAGIKVIRGDLVKQVLPHLRCNGFAIDVELMAWAKQLGYRRHAVHPVAFQHDGRSTVTLRRGIGALVSLIEIRRRLPTKPRIHLRRMPESRRERRVIELAAHAQRLAALGGSRETAAAELRARATDPRDLEAARRFLRGRPARSAGVWSINDVEQLLAIALDPDLVPLHPPTDRHEPGACHAPLPLAHGPADVVTSAATLG